MEMSEQCGEKRICLAEGEAETKSEVAGHESFRRGGRETLGIKAALRRQKRFRHYGEESHHSGGVLAADDLALGTARDRDGRADFSVDDRDDAIGSLFGALQHDEPVS